MQISGFVYPGPCGIRNSARRGDNTCRSGKGSQRLNYGSSVRTNGRKSRSEDKKGSRFPDEAALEALADLNDEIIKGEAKLSETDQAEDSDEEQVASIDDLVNDDAVYDNIFELPRFAAEVDELDDEIEEELGPDVFDDEEEENTAPNIPGYDLRARTRHINWKTWGEAGPKVDGRRCPGCGADFQTVDKARVGYISEKKLNESATSEEQAQKPIVCLRCFDLKSKNRVDDSLTVHGAAKSEHPQEQLDPEQTEKLLHVLRSQKAVVLYLVDVADFNGSCLRLGKIVGTTNPVIVGATKCDLLPFGFSPSRLKKWVEQQCKMNGVGKIHDVFLLNSVKGTGVVEMFDQALGLANLRNCDVYVVGAANTGKSSFINRLLTTGWHLGKSERFRRNLQTTTSVVPGTTLGIVPIATGDGRYVYDTPGVVLRDNVTTMLSPDELKLVTPSKSISTCGFRFSKGQSLLFGGLGRVDHVDGPPALCSWFCSAGIQVVPCATERADAYVRKHAGLDLTPPLGENDELEDRFEWESVDIKVTGRSWLESAADVAIAGLGWVSVTVNGTVSLRVRVPKGVKVVKRPPVMPYEAVFGAGKYTGSKWRNDYREQYVFRERQKLRRQKGFRSTRSVGPFPDMEAPRLKNFKGFQQ